MVNNETRSVRKRACSKMAWSSDGENHNLLRWRIIEYLFERQLKLATVEVIACEASTNEADINPRSGRSLLGVRLGLFGVVQEL